MRFLGNLMERDEIKLIYCKGVADTPVVKEALETDGETVVAFADDTDVFCLLNHHAMEYNDKSIYLSSLKTCVRTGRRTNINNRTVLSNSYAFNVKYILSNMRLVDAKQHPALTARAKLNFLGS